MRFVLVGIGSLGDVTPQLALAAELRDRGHAALVVGLAPYAGAAFALGVDYLPVPADTTALWPRDRLRRRLSLAQPGLMYLGMVQRLGAAAPVVNEALLGAVRPGDVLVSGLVTAGACALLAAERDVRCVPLLFAPLLPAESSASSALAPRLGGRVGALAGSRLMWRLSESLAAGHSDDMARRLGTRRPAGGPLGGATVLMATSPAITPPSARWPQRLVQTGWIRPAMNAAPLPAGLGDFLTEAPDAVLMTFGSCPVVDPAADAELFLAAAARADRAAVLQSDALPAGRVHDRAFNAPGVSHPALLPRVRAVVHHGGAGTTYASLAAGRPNVAVPHLGDQPYYARRVHALGAGPRGVPRWRLTTRVLADQVTAVSADGERYRAPAAAVAARLAAEDGRRRAADLLVAG